MLNHILKISSYLFHPIFISFYGVSIYYLNTVKFYPPKYTLIRLAQVFILTVLIPILFFRVLKKLHLINSIMAEKIEERKIPYTIAVALNLYISVFIFTNNTPELHYFFVAITFTNICFLLLSFLNYKASLHTAAISGLTMFTAALSIHYQIKIVALLGFLILANGLVTSSRLHLKAHTKTELIIGFILGFFPQFILMSYWI